MTASNLATCRVRLPHLNEKKNEDPSNRELHTKWANAIQNLFSPDPNSSPQTQIRNFDIFLHEDGSAENLIKTPQPTPQNPNPETKPKTNLYKYPPPYQLPSIISARLTTDEEKISRAELFALGSILYEISCGHALFHDVDVDEGDENENSGFFGSAIQERIIIGKFPEDLWDSELLARILVCWCPGFLKEMVRLSEKGKGGEKGDENEKGDEKKIEEDRGLKTYIKTHPYRFTLQVAGGLLTAASLAAVPVLGAIGFSTAGPVAGSVAAAWQSCVGIVEAGSLFAWCQSVTMGGAAVSGLIGAGVGGVGILAGATGLGVLDGVGGLVEGGVLREAFLRMWGREVRGE